MHMVLLVGGPLSSRSSWDSELARKEILPSSPARPAVLTLERRIHMYRPRHDAV